MDIYLIDNDRGGMSCTKTVNPGTTLGDFFAQVKPGSNPADYTVRLNNTDARLTQALNPHDRVVIAPKKFAGA